MSSSGFTNLDDLQVSMHKADILINGRSILSSTQRNVMQGSVDGELLTHSSTLVLHIVPDFMSLLWPHHSSPPLSS